MAITPRDKYKMGIDGAIHTLIINSVDVDDISQYTALCGGKMSTAMLLIEGESCTFGYFLSFVNTCKYIVAYVLDVFTR